MDFNRTANLVKITCLRTIACTHLNISQHSSVRNDAALSARVAITSAYWVFTVHTAFFMDCFVWSISLPHSSQCWDYRYVWPHTVVKELNNHKLIHEFGGTRMMARWVRTLSPQGWGTDFKSTALTYTPDMAVWLWLQHCRQRQAGLREVTGHLSSQSSKT